MKYAIYADFSRPLMTAERSAVSEALDANVPGSGCVGCQTGPNDEVYFSIEAPSDEEAIARAAHHMSIVVHVVGLDADYTLTVQATDGIRRTSAASSGDRPNDK
jgi:hypothetical protein